MKRSNRSKLVTKIYHSSAGLCPKTDMSSYLFCNFIPKKKKIRQPRIWNNFDNSATATCKVYNEGSLNLSHIYAAGGRPPPTIKSKPSVSFGFKSKLNKTRILCCSIEVNCSSIFVKNHYAPSIFVTSDFRAKQEAVYVHCIWFYSRFLCCSDFRMMYWKILYRLRTFDSAKNFPLAHYNRLNKQTKGYKSLRSGNNHSILHTNLYIKITWT
jgi:hypothetical protein